VVVDLRRGPPVQRWKGSQETLDSVLACSQRHSTPSCGVAALSVACYPSSRSAHVSLVVFRPVKGAG